MVTSVTDICNRALYHVGVGRILSLDDGTKVSDDCKFLYPQCRDEIIRLHRWKCIMRRANIAKLAEAPAHTYSSYHALPSDCLRLWEVVGLDEEYYTLEGRNILSDVTGSMAIVYGAQIEDVSQYDPLFVAALAAYMAIHLAEPLTQSSSLKETVSRLYDKAIENARMASALEDSARTRAIPSIIMNRL